MYFLRGYWLVTFLYFYRIYVVIASAGISFFLFYKIRLKNDTLIQEKLTSRNYPKIIGIVNIIVLCVIALLILIFPGADRDEFFQTFLVFSLLTYGLLFIIGIMVYIVVSLTVLYFMLFLIPLNVGSIVFTILRKNHLTKNNMIFNISINSLAIIINYFIHNNYNFYTSIPKFIDITKGFIYMVIGVFTLIIGGLFDRIFK
jgi:hypothetical protein